MAEKVNAPWEKIKGLGDDKQLAKKIIFCFTYENETVLPIFSTNHLRFFVTKIAAAPILATKFYSLGEEYEYLTSELIKTKNSNSVIGSWETTYFTRFLYDSFPPPDREVVSSDSHGGRNPHNEVTEEQLELGAFVKLLGELQKKGKINGEQFRAHREVWVNQPQDRRNLTERLKTLLNQ